MAGVSILSKVEGQAECFLSKLKVKCASRELREPEQDSANQISEASWLRVKRGPEEQGSEALLCPVLQDVTALSSSSLCATRALPVGLPIPRTRQGFGACSPFKAITLKGSSLREVGWGGGWERCSQIY